MVDEDHDTDLVIAAARQRIVGSIDEDEFEGVLSDLGLALVYARMLEQGVRMLAMALRLNSDEGVEDVEASYDETRWAAARRVVLDRWPDEVEQPDSLGERLEEFWRYRSTRLAHGLCDDLILALLSPVGDSSALKDELQDFAESTRDLWEQLQPLALHVAAERGVGAAGMGAAAVLLRAIQLYPDEFSDAPLHDADRWAPKLMELSPQLIEDLTDVDPAELPIQE